MPGTNIEFLLPHMNRGATSTIKVEANAQRENTSLFGEMLDTVNPLHHVPGVSQAYRAVTNDKISEGAKLAGHVGLGAAVGGPVGAAIGAGVFLIESVFGTLFGGGKKGGEKLVQAENMKSAPAALTGDQAIHAGVMRPRSAATPAQAAQAQQQAQAADNRPAAPALGTAPVDMSSAQFAALLGAFGTPAPVPASSNRDDERTRATQPPQNSAAINPALNPDDFAARMAANLDKLDALKRGSEVR